MAWSNFVPLRTGDDEDCCICPAKKEVSGNKTRDGEVHSKCEVFIFSGNLADSKAFRLVQHFPTNAARSGVGWPTILRPMQRKLSVVSATTFIIEPPMASYL